MPFGCASAPRDGILDLRTPPVCSSSNATTTQEGRTISLDSDTAAALMGQIDGDNSAEKHNERIQSGQCIICGTQLFEVKTKTRGIFKSSSVEVRVPLSIPGQVERGQCLQCGGQESSQIEQQQRLETRPVVGEDSHVVDAQTRDGLQIGSSCSKGKAVYEGSFNIYGERDGDGTMTWENGDVYKGGFFNGNRHGHGTLSFADGSEYVGEWECNLQHGIGTRRWVNGDCYTGQYRNGKRTGEGRFYFSNGDMYTGNFSSGVMEGFGRYYYASGQRFEGNFSRGHRRGKGKLQRTDGSLDVGVYDKDVRTGPGVRWSADRTQAWSMLDGLVKKKISVAEAVAMDYDIDAAVQALDDGMVV